MLDQLNTKTIRFDRLVQAVGEITDNATKAVVVCCVIFLIAHVSVHISIWGKLTNWGAY